MIDQQRFRKAAVQFFYPQASWGGCYRFFQPHLPPNLGFRLWYLIDQGLKQEDPFKLTKAAMILSTRIAGCEPTSQALEGIELLNDVIGEMLEFPKSPLFLEQEKVGI